MAIPKHDEIRIPALQLLKEKGDLKLKDFTEPLGEYFNLTEEELNREYDSGNGLIFYDRISWALSYLNMSGLLNKPKRGVYQINEEGLRILERPETINSYIEKKLEERNEQKQSNRVSEDRITISDSSSEQTPQENLYNSYLNIRKAVYKEILDTIISKQPSEFERLVVKLLQKMGYGGEIKDSAIVTQKTRDGGIDGIIKEDILGLGRINIQAKRYGRNNPIGRQLVQNFVGALAGVQSNKGIFITTSYYTNDALEYAENINANIILIDGEQLAEYIYDFGLGMQIEEVIKIKRLESDFWDEMKDDKDDAI